ncbi:MAG: molybdopterin molybdotransferase MoeA [Alphaproteobacteria bacterium]|nr:molybdopterin molybdotransferase MoeA [Alphaproteobacteria bacterium]
MISFDEAIGRVIELAKPLGTEKVALDQADGRYVARQVIAPFNSPATPMSAMDGYAVRDTDVARTPVSLQIVGKSFAGLGYCGEFPLRSCVRVFTGASVPRGTDRVVIQEKVQTDGSKAIFVESPSERRHIRNVGSDFLAGDVLVAAGCQLSPQRLVAAAAADVAELEVFRQPRVFIICCGDELSEPGQSRNRPGSIPESISFGVAALARRWGANVVGRARKPDELEELQAVAASAVELADVIVVIGGASVGEKDFAKDMFAPLGLEFVFNKVAIKPGKPVWMGRLGERIVIGLPGNPTSALVTARLFLAPLLTGMVGGDANVVLAWRKLPLTVPVDACAERETFLRARADVGGVRPLSNQDSAAQKAIADCNLLIRHRAGAPPVAAGTLVEAVTF